MSSEQKEQFKKWLLDNLYYKGRKNLEEYTTFYFNCFLRELEYQVKTSGSNEFILSSRESKEGKELIFKWE